MVLPTVECVTGVFYTGKKLKRVHIGDEILMSCNGREMNYLIVFVFIKYKKVFHSGHEFLIWTLCQRPCRSFCLIATVKILSRTDLRPSEFGLIGLPDVPMMVAR